MYKNDFCLLYEPWILVIRPDGVTEEISLLQLFENAHQYKGLAGELPTQDIAIMRVLLAIVHTVYGRANHEGNPEPISSPSMALKRWKTLWDQGKFSLDLIKRYLQHFEDRFWLFHEQYPFYQVPELGKSTEYTAAKLYGALSESGNKIRLFPQRSGDSKSGMPYGEAARWLIYINGFDDTAAKPSQKGLASPGVGWLGKLGLVVAIGDNLFETLLLNLVLLPDGSNKLWGEEDPVWEKKVKKTERDEIVMPDNPSGLLTLQSRRLLLKRDNNRVIGYNLLGGDFFPRQNAFLEQMTLWRNTAKKADASPEYNPKRHDPARQLWRDFSILAAQGEGVRLPGVVGWLRRLKVANLIPSTHIRFQTAAVKYGDKDFFVDDVFSDSISFNVDLLIGLGENWVSRIVEEVNTTEMLVEQVGRLAQNLARATGNTEGNGPKNIAKEQAYYQLDTPFKQWLEDINPNKDNDKKDQICDQWWLQAKQIIRALGRELINQSGPQAFVGRTVINEKTKKEYRYIAPELYNRFLYYTSNRELLHRRGG
jgi:CRISPR system Cascade subunit CasA